MNDHVDQRLGVLLVAGAAVSWSTAGYFAQLVHVALFPTLVWRNLFGGAFMLGFMLWTLRGATLQTFFGLGLIGWFAAVLNGVSMLAYLGALRHTSVANVVVIYASAPFVAAGIGYLLYRDRTSRGTLGAGMLAIVGVAVTVAGTPGSTGLFGDLLALVMTFCLSLFTIIARRHRDRSMLAASTASAFIGALVALPFCDTLRVSSVQLGQLALFGVTSFGLGLILYSIGARHLPPARSALITALDTPLAPVWVWIAFGAAPAVASVIGGVIVMLAVVANIVGEPAPRLPAIAFDHQA